MRGWFESPEEGQYREGPQGHRGQEGLCLREFLRGFEVLRGVVHQELLGEVGLHRQGYHE